MRGGGNDPADRRAPPAAEAVTRCVRRSLAIALRSVQADLARSIAEEMTSRKINEFQSFLHDYFITADR
jgi:hypothetical protein